MHPRLIVGRLLPQRGQLPRDAAHLAGDAAGAGQHQGGDAHRRLRRHLPERGLAAVDRRLRDLPRGRRAVQPRAEDQPAAVAAEGRGGAFRGVVSVGLGLYLHSVFQLLF